MKKYLLLLTAAAIAAFTSCTKESELDPTIVNAINSQSPLEFTAYASSATSTKGSAIDSNISFQKDGSFDVSAIVSNSTYSDYLYDNQSFVSSYTVTPDANDTAVQYFGLSQVKYITDKWVNTNNMYWPNYDKSIHFAACSPSGLLKEKGGDEDEDKYDYEFTYETDSERKETYKYSFDYKVTNTVKDQIDLMYAMTTVDYLAPTNRYKEGSPAGSYVTTGVTYTNTEDPVNLHFKHALTQVAFTATKDDDIDVYVKSVTICNVYNSGTFSTAYLTDDEDADAENNPTVGDAESVTVEDEEANNDKVNADNFGTWAATFSGTWALSGETTATTGGFSAMSNYEAVLNGYTHKSPTATTDDKNSIRIGLVKMVLHLHLHSLPQQPMY